MRVLRDEEGRPDSLPPDPGLEERLREPGEGPRLRCAACRAPVTSRAERIEVHGAHAHRRVNPSGHDFHVGCFRRAPGAAAEGAPTLHWTWFPGYAWRIARCRACGEHLGWAFTGDGEAFYGLILARLVEDDAGASP